MVRKVWGREEIISANEYQQWTDKNVGEREKVKTARKRYQVSGVRSEWVYQ